MSATQFNNRCVSLINATDEVKTKAFPSELNAIPGMSISSGLLSGTVRSPLVCSAFGNHDVAVYVNVNVVRAARSTRSAARVRILRRLATSILTRWWHFTIVSAPYTDLMHLHLLLYT
jgi:hypothetical protein